MMLQNFMPVIYGVLFILLALTILNMMYSVYYTPGSTVLYNSPVTQKIFPEVPKKLFPTWGYNKAGMYDGQPFKFGQGSFWPESGKGFVPNKNGSPGASPSGGMRPSFTIPSEVEVGFWGYSPKPERAIDINIYDNSEQSVEYTTPIGWWGE